MLQNLYDSYRQSKTDAVSAISDGMFPPLLISLPDEWEHAEHRIAFVGQETLDWSWTKESAAPFGYEWEAPDLRTLSDFFQFEQSVEALTAGYKQFNFSERQPGNVNSPFWRYFRKLRDVYSSQAATSAIFTNVIRCAVDASSGFTLWSMTSEQRRAYLDWQRGLLNAELREIRPTIIFFATGPYYDPFLAEEFDGIRFKTLGDFPQRQLARLDGGGLTAPAYRTYHPGYLSRTSGFASLDAAMGDAASNR